MSYESLPAGTLNRRVTIERRSVSRDSATGAEVATWATVATVWAFLRESSTAAGLNRGKPDAIAVSARPSRVRIRYRSGIDRTMRLNFGGGRVLRILGIAEVGKAKALEFACEDWSYE